MFILGHFYKFTIVISQSFLFKSNHGSPAGHTAGGPVEYHIHGRVQDHLPVLAPVSNIHNTILYSQHLESFWSWYEGASLADLGFCRREPRKKLIYQ